MNETAWAAILGAILAGSVARAETGSKACATCHAEIYQAYQATGMAQSSGTAAPTADPGEFVHKLSGVRYKVSGQSFSFDLPGVHGTRPLEYFIGSGTVGQSYAYRMDGFLYQAPVSWYSARAKWDLSPGFEKYDHLFLTRPIEPACLECHASQLEPVVGTANGYRSPPFSEGGVSCERCHGPGDRHVRGQAKMLNPAKLPPDLRDSICEQCHLTGEARIARESVAFSPGKRFSDHAAVFVWSGGNPDMKVTSHFERLSVSACKLASGDRLWCGSCHDSHRVPGEKEKAAFYQTKCLECHQASQCVRGPDCAACHMPKNAVRDIQHATYTEHAIRIPGRPAVSSKRERKLVPFGLAKAGDREFGLAYAEIPGFSKEAIQYLERASQDDADVLVHLAFLYDSSGREDKALPLYEKALSLDPAQVTAAVNLAIGRMKRGKTGDAIHLWQQALEHSPGLENARLSLAAAEYRLGNVDRAEAQLVKLLELNPGATSARRLLNDLRARHR